MENKDMSEDKKGFFQNDLRLVCSLLAVYGICIFGLIATTFWGFNNLRETISANATSTAFALATQQTNATATAVVRSTEQAQYELVDRFNSNVNNWETGYRDNEYWKGNMLIEEGVYLWDVQETKKTFISRASFYTNDYLKDNVKDFDAYVDTKVLDAKDGDVCSGFIFRKSPDGFDAGGYYFALCNDSYVNISFRTEKDGWQNIAYLQNFNYYEGWNRLEIIARGTHFTFLINGELIYEMDDDRQKVGKLELVIELNNKVPAKVLFDNFGFQSR